MEFCWCFVLPSIPSPPPHTPRLMSNFLPNTSTPRRSWDRHTAGPGMQMALAPGPGRAAVTSPDMAIHWQRHAGQRGGQSARPSLFCLLLCVCYSPLEPRSEWEHTPAPGLNTLISPEAFAVINSASIAAHWEWESSLLAPPLPPPLSVESLLSSMQIDATQFWGQVWGPFNPLWKD